MPTRRQFLGVAGSVAFAGCGSGGDEATGQGTGTPTGQETDTPTGGTDFSLTSPAFDDGGPIPTEFTGDGADVSPPLTIADTPDEAASLALIVDDPDAPTGRFVHWLCWAIPPETTEIPRDRPQTERLETPAGAIQGTNDFDELGYRGPLPPKEDDAHTYVFTLVALSEPLDVAPGGTRADLDAATDSLVLDRTQLRGTYDRS